MDPKRGIVIEHFDSVQSQTTLVIVRRAHESIELAISLRKNGDVAAYMTLEDAGRVIEALEACLKA